MYVWFIILVLLAEVRVPLALSASLPAEQSECANGFTPAKKKGRAANTIGVGKVIRKRNFLTLKLLGTHLSEALLYASDRYKPIEEDGVAQLLSSPPRYRYAPWMDVRADVFAMLAVKLDVWSAMRGSPKGQSAEGLGRDMLVGLRSDLNFLDAYQERELFRALGLLHHEASILLNKAFFGNGKLNSAERDLLNEILRASHGIRNRIADTVMLLYLNKLSLYREAPFYDDLEFGFKQALVHTIYLFNPEIKIRFTTYFVNALNNAVKVAKKKYAGAQKKPVMFATMGDLDGEIKPDAFQDISVERHLNELSAAHTRETINQILEEGVSQLEERERKVLEMYYGFHGYDAMVYEEIGAEFSITKERARQILKGAHQKLRRFAARQGIVWQRE